MPIHRMIFFSFVRVQEKITTFSSTHQSKAYGESRSIAPHFLSLRAHGGKCSPSHPGGFIQKNKSTLQLTGVLVCPTAHLELSEEQTISCCCRDWNHRPWNKYIFFSLLHRAFFRVNYCINHCTYIKFTH